ncbi:hypothetical protein [Marinobacter salsuginis]|uniref:Uncharacterized protein n=1 Tax=Marinobacter salsuginis TaxID=418719 RepID=A0A5M3Q1Z7_9GAMM|nr:hypothetical protein [Marinobacter salsuginis]GBO89203.1 hypothetical protein MSSD14B_28710 [Marinobacter salsuginis]
MLFKCLLKVRGTGNDEALAVDEVEAETRPRARDIMIERHWDERLTITSRPHVVILGSRKAPGRGTA